MKTIAHSRPCLGPAEEAAVQEVVASAMLASGENCRLFETQVGLFLQCRPGIAFASGAQALHAIIQAMLPAHGGDVLVPTYACASIARAIIKAGATPVFFDCAPDGRIDADRIRPRRTDRTIAIVVAPVFGLVPDMEALTGLNLPLIADLAQSFGGTYDSRPLSAFALATFCSFQATKLLTTGEGGMALTDNPELHDRLHNATGAHCLSDIQASIGLVQLHRFPEFAARRRQIASLYNNRLADIPNVTLPAFTSEEVPFRYVLRTEGRDFEAMKKAFEAHGIQIRKGVDGLAHKMVGLGEDREFPEATRCLAGALSLPLYPALDDSDVERVARAAEAILS